MNITNTTSTKGNKPLDPVALLRGRLQPRPHRA